MRNDVNGQAMHARLSKALETNTNKPRASQTCFKKQYLYCVPVYNCQSPLKNVSGGEGVLLYH